MTRADITYWIESIIKLIPIGGLIFAVYQFNSQQSRINKDEFDRQMFIKSLESYSKMTQTVGKITTLKMPKDSTKYDSLQSAFDEMYWGSLLLVEQENVRKALAQLKGELIDVRFERGSIENIRARQEYLANEFRVALKSYKDLK